MENGKVVFEEVLERISDVNFGMVYGNIPLIHLHNL